jgi:D-inositol-3-phosphate glycosyltransferase
MNTIRRSEEFDLRLVSLATSARDGVSVGLLSPSTWLEGVRVRGGVWEAVPFHHVGAFLTEFEFQRYRQRRALSEVMSGCDLIQVVSGSPAWANAVVGIGKPVSLHVATRARVERRRRDAMPAGLADRWRRAMTTVTDGLDDRALRSVDAVQVMNPWMLDYVRQLNRHREVDIRYAPPGVDARSFTPESSGRLAGEPYILCVGRLDDPRKNVGLLLEAYAKLPGFLRAATRLVLAGSAGPRPGFWARAEALGLRSSVQFVKRPDHDALVRLYQNTAVFALPSDEEGFGVVLLEAMACGVPVVATRCGGPDGIITDGIDGFLVPRGDAGALAARLQELLESSERNDGMGRHARATIESRYAEEVAGEPFLEVWDRLLALARRH